jgi:hypothetical protein
MNLTDWLTDGWLTEHHTSKREISDLWAVASRDLRTSQMPDLDPDWRLNIAYNAALQLATAALAACGYRAAKEAYHVRVLQSLRLTIGLDEALVQQLDQFRRKRHLGAYERAGLVSRLEAEAIFALATQLQSTILAWLQREHPELLP